MMLAQQVYPIRDRVAVVVLSQSSGIKFILGLISILIGIGFVIGDTDRRNYALLIAAGPPAMWACIYILHGALKLLDAVYKLPYLLSISISIFGTLAWNYIFLSLTFFSIIPISPLGLILLLPILCEVWSLTTTIYYNTHTMGDTNA